LVSYVIVDQSQTIESKEEYFETLLSKYVPDRPKNSSLVIFEVNKTNT